MKQRYSKWVRRYPNGTLGSTTCVDTIIEDPKPLATYRVGEDTYPEHGYLMCWKGIRESNIERSGIKQDVCLWEVEVDVADVKVPTLAHPFYLRTGKITIEEFWKNPEAQGYGFTGQTPPAQTVFCTRVRLIKNLTEELETQHVL